MPDTTAPIVIDFFHDASSLGTLDGSA
jgi:hypothetical protein